jgi:hypothetical protein
MLVLRLGVTGIIGSIWFHEGVISQQVAHILQTKSVIHFNAADLTVVRGNIFTYNEDIHLASMCTKMAIDKKKICM